MIPFVSKFVFSSYFISKFKGNPFMKRIFLFAACMCLTFLSGCTFRSGDNLLQPPKPSATYESLQKQINDIAEKGAIAVSPQTGENRNTVQLMDLDLDGEDEAVAFFCESKNPDKFHVYVFQRENEHYVSVGSVSSTATQINSVSYPVLSSDGKRGIIISWKLNDDDSNMTVCSFANNKLSTVLESKYQSFTTSDLDNNGTDDIVLFTKDASGRRIAHLYVSESGQKKLSLKGEAMLSPETQSIVSLKRGLLRGYQPAIFAESKVEISTGLMTDIFVYDSDGFRNITLESEDGIEHSTYRPVSVPSTDVNNDQVVEVPLAVSMAGTSAKDAIYMLDWYAYSSGDAPVRVCTTYQNVSENWQFFLSDDWRKSVTVTKYSEDDISNTTFNEYIADTPNSPYRALVTIYRFTGDMRNYYASREGMIELARTPTEIYAAKIPETAKESSIAITENDIKDRFSIISQSWSN